jgi:ribosome biogenesis GTPase / thiamine phosphate phosphatase
VSDEDHFLFEEAFYSQERKASRKQRKLAKAKDRSKFKKSDQDQLKKRKPKIPVADENVKQGRVLAITPEGILVGHDHLIYTCTLKGALKQETSRIKNLIAVGDFVQFLTKDENEGLIVHVLERHSVLSRADTLSRQREQLIAVNIDQVLIVTSVILPPLKPFLVDRYIIAAKKGKMQPVIVINKLDLLTTPPLLVDTVTLEEEKMLFTQFKEAYSQLGIPIVCVSAITKEGLDTLKELMRNKSSVLSGQSGVGKSSLINALLGKELATREIVAKTSKGAHTTSTAHLIPLDEGGFCIDTPGIRSFGMWELEPAEVQTYFPDILYYVSQCKYPDCRHLKEPDCAVKRAVKEKKLSDLRFASYCAIMESLKEEHRIR